MTNAFRYPGSKARLAPWVCENLPSHERYVEPFGGSAAVLLAKDRSTVEILNDLDENIVQFFRVLRDRGDELAEWFEATPFSRRLHSEWWDDYRRGDYPNDEVERAGRFLYLHTVSVNGIGGFGVRKRDRDPTNHFRSKPEKIRQFATRLRGAVIENIDYGDVVEKYDGPDAAFYFDPPYIGAGDSLYGHGEFDHSRFVDVILGMDAKWIVSYSELPDGLDSSEFHVLERVKHNHMRSGSEGGEHGETDTERLVMNFDPTTIPRHAPKRQRTLTEVA